MIRTRLRSTWSRRAVPGAAALMLTLLATPARAQCEELEAKVELLNRHIVALQKQIIALKTEQKAPDTGKSAPAVAETKPEVAASAPGRQQAAAARGAGRDEAVALYDRIDDLLGAGQIEQARQALQEFNTTHEGTPAVAWTRSLTRELTAVGKPAPEDWFIDHWFQGESDVKLAGGTTTVLVFWESWCPHCRDEVPKLQAIHDRYRSRGLQVVGFTRLTRSATEETVRAFIAEHDVSYPMAKENGALAEYFSVKGIPAAAVVKDGRVVWRGHPTRLVPELLERWL